MSDLSQSVGGIHIKVGFDIQSLNNSLKTLQTQIHGGLGNIQKSVDQTAKNTQGMFGKMLASNLVTSAINLLSQAVFNVGKSMIDTSSQFEKFETQLKVMLGSTTAAKQRLKELSDFAKSTPFELPQVVNMGNRLQALGKYSIETMTTLGDLASASGKPIEQVLNAFSKLSSGQKGEAKMMFQDLLITTQDWVNATGKGVSKSGELLATTEEMLSAIPKIIQSKGFTGMMDQQSKTFEGMMSNMKDSFTQTMGNLGIAVLPFAKLFIGEITNMNNELLKGVTSLKEWLFSAEGIEKTSTIFGNIAGAVGGYLKGIQIFFDNIKNAVVPVINTVREQIEKLGLDKLTGKLDIARISANVFAAVINFNSAMFRIVGASIQAVIRTVGDLILTFQKTGQFLATFGSSAINVFKNFVEAIKQAVETGKLGFEALTDPLNKEKRGKFFESIGTIKGKWDNLTKSVTDGTKDVLKSGGEVINQIIETGKSYVEIWTGPIKQAIEEVEEFPENQRKISEEIYQKSLEDAKKYKDKVKELMTSDENNKNTNQNTKDTKILDPEPQKKTFKEFLFSVKNYLIETGEAVSDGLNDIMSSASDGISNLVNTVLGSLDDLKNESITLTEAVSNIVKSAAEGMSQLASSIGNAVVNIMKNDTDNILNELDNRHQKELDALKEKHDLENELLENDGKTKLEALQQKLSELEAVQTESNDLENQKRQDLLASYAESLQGETDADIQRALQAKEIELRKKSQSDQLKNQEERENIQREIRQIELQKKQVAEEKALKQKQVMDKYNIERELFDKEKDAKTSQIWIQYALGSAAMMASVWQLGPIAGPILGAILGSGLLAGAIANTILVNKQQFPPPPQFAEGVTGFEGGPAIVGEKGPELVTFGRSANVITNENISRLFSQAQNMIINLTNHVLLDGRVIATEVKEIIVDDRRYALAQ